MRREKEHFGVECSLCLIGQRRKSIHYKFICTKILQLEWNNWSVPQGSNEKDGEDPVEQKALLLEKWYDSLESLSNTSRQMLSEEPFYRLYEIKVPHHNRKGSCETKEST